jgi:hypothetical protein
VDSRAGLDGVEKIIDPTATRTPTPRSSSYTDYGIPEVNVKTGFATQDIFSRRGVFENTVHDSKKRSAISVTKINQ